MFIGKKSMLLFALRVTFDCYYHTKMLILKKILTNTIAWTIMGTVVVGSVSRS